MSEERTYQKAGLLVVFVVLCASVINTMSGLVNPLLATMAKTYPDVSLSTIQLVATLPMLAAIPTSFLAGKIINKLGSKWAMILSFSVFMISSVVPAFFRTNFMPILVCRFINGLSCGLLNPVNSTLVNSYIEPERRPAIFGYKQGIGNATGLLMTSMVGIIATISIFYTWYINLVLLLPICLALLLPKAPQWETPAPAAQADTAAVAKKDSIPGKAWGIILLMFLFSVFSYPALLNLSSLIDINNMGDAAISGFIATTANIGGILGTLFFGKIFKKLGTYVIPVFMLLLVVRHVLFGLTASVPLYFVANFVGGIGYFGLFVAFNTCLSACCSSGTFAVAAGVMSALMSVGMFVASYIMNFFAALAGQAGSLVFPVLVGGAAFAVLAVVLFVKPLKV